MIKFWHVCYGSVDGQRDVFDDHAAGHDAAVRRVSGGRGAPGVPPARTSASWTRSPPSRRTRCSASAWWTRRTLWSSRSSQIADRIRRCLKVVPADWLLVSPDCGLGYFSRTTAYAKLRNMGQAAAEVRKAL